MKYYIISICFINGKLWIGPIWYKSEAVIAVAIVANRNAIGSTQKPRSYETGQDQKWKNKRGNESGGNHKESTGKKVEVVWACDEKRWTLRRKEGDGNESAGEKAERKT